MGDRRQEDFEAVMQMVKDVLPSIKARRAMDMMKEQNKTMDDIYSERDLVLKGMDMFLKDAGKCEDWEELCLMMIMIFRTVVEASDINRRLIYGFMVTCFLNALKAGSPIDLDIVLGRLEININATKRDIYRQYEETINEIKKQTSGSDTGTSKEGQAQASGEEN